MKIFVAGGTGAIGRRLVPLLEADGHDVTVLARDPGRASALLPHSTGVVEGDVFDAKTISRLVAQAGPDLIMHQLTDLSAGSSAANARIRTEGTHNLVEAAIAAGVGSIVVQSIAWCYQPGDEPATEDVGLDDGADDPTRQATVAAIKTMEAEAGRLARMVALRNGTLYGPGTWYAPDGVMSEFARAGQLPATPGITSFVHVDDAAAAAAAAVNWPAGAVNIVDDEPAAGRDWMPEFARRVAAPEPPFKDAAQPWERGAINRRARDLGWVPRWASWRSGFANALESDR